MGEDGEEVKAMRWSDDGRMLAVGVSRKPSDGPLDRVVKVFDTESGELLSVSGDHSGGITALAFGGPGGELVASGAGDFAARVSFLTR